MTNAKVRFHPDQAALVLRIGLGLVFFSGGIAKLSRLLFPDTQADMVNLYLSPAGYINQFFYDYLFTDGILSNLMTPWFFLTSLSALELLVGFALIIGLGVRAFSLLFAFLCWSFVISLPVVNAPGFEIAAKTHTAPAILVMIRDIAISGALFVLYNLGPGSWSIDKRLFGVATQDEEANWDALGLLLRLSIGFVFLVGGAFYGMENIKSFAHPAILLAIGFILVIGNGARYAAFAGTAVILWYMFNTMSLEKDLIGNMNSIKREFALLGSTIVLGVLGGGNSHTLLSLFASTQSAIGSKTPSSSQEGATA
ncbi:MAG: DoxX family protein [Chloroflexota bacterium]